MNYQIPQYEDATKLATNKFMYVKQHLLDSIQNGQPKVLVNPNFMQIAHVRPHFNKQFLQNQTIHVNPNMLKRSESEPKVEPKVKVANAAYVPNKAIVTTPTKLIRVPQKGLDSRKALVFTHTKLVWTAKPKIETPRPSQSSLCTKYKIIRQPGEKPEANIKKLYYVRNRFRIDHRLPSGKLSSSQKVIRRSRFKYVNTINTKNIYVKCNSKLNKTQFVSINGILYRRSFKSLVNMNKTKNTKSSKLDTKKRLKEQLVTIRGQKYKLDSNHRTLTLLSAQNGDVKPSFKTIYLGGVTFKQKEPNIFVKTNQKHVMLSQAKQRSIHTLTNKMRKSNIPCPFYRKFGRCKGKEKGTCCRIHNPDQVSLCPKFLQGACISDKCLLSHKVSAEKMPTCKFFLEGLCSKDDCPYLHVKINAKAEICKDFLEGFCKSAAECEKRHQYLCPDFEKSASCVRRRCPYPHGSMVRKYKFSRVASKLQTQSNRVKASKADVKSHPVSTSKATAIPSISHKAINIDPEKVSNVRYYDDSKPNVTTKPTDVQKESEFEIVDLDLEQNASFASPLRSRPKVGALPSFIPFLSDECS